MNQSPDPTPRTPLHFWTQLYSRLGDLNVRHLLTTLLKIALIPIMFVTVIALPFFAQRIMIASLGASRMEADLSEADLVRTEDLLQKEVIKLDKQLSKATPKSYFLVINTSANEFSLYQGHALVKKDKCSTGSYLLLKNGDQQQWMFKTPKGEFTVRSKTTSPVWKKPDWAFIEEGLPVPSADHSSRFEYGVLGDYALNLGHGYLIHGTLYQRFLGLPVTHGCIRLNDENLELVYRSLPLGSKVYIF